MVFSKSCKILASTVMAAALMSQSAFAADDVVTFTETVGSFGTLYLFAGIYLVALLGFGLLVSTYTNNQLQAMFVAFFFMMIFMLMSGLFTSVDSMPGWAKVIANLTPVTHFIKVMRMIVLKGSGLADVQPELLYLVAFAVVLNGWAILNYRKTN